MSVLVVFMCWLLIFFKCVMYQIRLRVSKEWDEAPLAVVLVSFMFSRVAFKFTSTCAPKGTAQSILCYHYRYQVP